MSAALEQEFDKKEPAASSMLAVAQAVLDDLGARAFPLQPRLKIPLPGSAGFKDSSFDHAQIKEWWSKHPDANVGIDCGGSNLQVLDFDNETDIPAWVSGFKTYKVKTSRGVHVYFRGSRPTAKMFDANGKHIGEIKSSGGYVLAAGSIHESGSIYTIIDPRDISKPPVELIDKLVKNNTPTKSPADKSASIFEGSRNNALTSLGGDLRIKGFDKEFILTALLDANQKRCSPMLPEDEVRRIAESVSRYEVGHELDFTVSGKNPYETIAAKANDLQSATNANAAPQELEPFFTVNGDIFMQENIPPRTVLIRTISHGEPVFFGPSINQIFAWRGMGKTNLGFGLVAALSRGEKFLNWEAPEPVKVLYVEGELPAAQVQERWKQIIGTTNGQARLITIDKQTNSTMTSLATTQGMDRLEKTLATLEADGFKVQVLFLDSISTLFNVGANDEETWIAIQAWFISLRSRGICIFFFHHAGKSGLSRSHSKSEDMLDVSIKLEAPKEPEPGCLHAVMTYDKARSGLSEAPAEIKMHRAHSAACECKKTGKLGCSGDSVTWLYEPAISIKKQQALGMFADGMTVRAVAKELKAPIGTINSWRTQWADDRRAADMKNIKVNGITLDAPSVPVANA